MWGLKNILWPAFYKFIAQCLWRPGPEEREETETYIDERHQNNKRTAFQWTKFKIADTTLIMAVYNIRIFDVADK